MIKELKKNIEITQTNPEVALGLRQHLDRVLAEHQVRTDGSLLPLLSDQVGIGDAIHRLLQNEVSRRVAALHEATSLQVGVVGDDRRHEAGELPRRAVLSLHQPGVNELHEMEDQAPPTKSQISQLLKKTNEERTLPEHQELELRVVLLLVGPRRRRRLALAHVLLRLALPLQSADSQESLKSKKQFPIRVKFQTITVPMISFSKLSTHEK